LFENLQQYRVHLDLPSQRDRSWIAADTWASIDHRAELRRRALFNNDGNIFESEIRQLGKNIHRLLRRDRRHRAERTGEEIAAKLAAKDIHGAFNCLQAWYKHRVKKSVIPTVTDSKIITEDYAELFAARPSFGEPLPIHVQPFPILDSIPDKEEIKKALKRMKRGKCPGVSGITVEDLLRWCDSVPDAWTIVVTLVQQAFEDGTIPTAFAYGILCLIPKSVPDKFRPIALLEVIYKLCSTIIHMRLGEAIVFHPSIHGFRSGRGTGTAILEAKLLMQIFACEANPLFQVFLDLTKAYDSLDRDRTMAILAAYGIGPRTCRLIQAIWDSDTMFPKQAGIYGEPFHAQRGVRQGDVISPDIFNIIVDCVIREWYHQINAFVPDPLLALSALFYADDGKLAGSTPSLVQTGLDLFVQLFRRIGLELNATKTQTMICLGPKPLGHMSTTAYKRRFDQSFPTH
jgi:hypothetical protein